MSVNIRCLIVEDERPAQQVMMVHISRLPFLSLVAVVANVDQALSYLQNNAVDLVFADIHLPGVTGLHLAQSLPPTTGIVFTTAHDQYAIKGFELNAVDYLLKPISFSRFQTAVDRYLRHFYQEEVPLQSSHAEPQRPFIFMRCERMMTRIFLDEIIYLEAQRNCLLIQTATVAYKTNQSISEVEEKLPAGHFLRVHRSFIVSVKQINSVNARRVIIGQTTIPIGRLYRKEVARVIGF